MTTLRFTLRQLEYFVAVGQAGSIAQAAQRLHVSSPSISTALTQLEGAFGVPLFVRRPAQGLALTQSGRQFMAAAEALLADAGRLNDLAHAITGTVGGSLATGCLTPIAQVMLPYLRRSFVTLHPDVIFLPTEGDQAVLYEGLRRGTIDCALTYDLDVPRDLEFAPLATLPLYALLAADHPLALQGTVSLGDLAPLPMVLLDLPYSSDYFLGAFADAGLTPRVAERTRDTGMMRSLVAGGFGYAVANVRAHTMMAPDGGVLVARPIRPAARPIHLGLVTVAGGQSALTTRAFLDHCRAEVAAGRAPGITP